MVDVPPRSERGAHRQIKSVALRVEDHHLRRPLVADGKSGPGPGIIHAFRARLIPEECDRIFEGVLDFLREGRGDRLPVDIAADNVVSRKLLGGQSLVIESIEVPEDRPLELPLSPGGRGHFDDGAPAVAEIAPDDPVRADLAKSVEVGIDLIERTGLFEDHPHEKRMGESMPVGLLDEQGFSAEAQAFVVHAGLDAQIERDVHMDKGVQSLRPVPDDRRDPADLAESRHIVEPAMDNRSVRAPHENARAGHHALIDIVQQADGDDGAEGNARSVGDAPHLIDISSRQAGGHPPGLEFDPSLHREIRARLGSGPAI